MIKFIGNFPLKEVTTLHIGGPAKKFVVVKTEQELTQAISFAKQNNLDYLVIGGGSNLLVNDEGVDCLVIKNEITGINPVILGSEATPESDSGQARMTLKVKSGTNLQDLVGYTIKHGLSGLQKLIGIPGTVGGAVYGNAGAYGQTISDHLTKVTVLNPSVIPANVGIQLTKNIYGSRIPSASHFGRELSAERLRAGKSGMTKEDCNFGYRDSGFKRNKFTILEVTFQLASGDSDALKQEANDVLSKRLIKYPKGIKCPGSFFKNIVAETLPKNILAKIPKDKITYGKISAGYLLEAVGALEQRLDGIEIASYHANLFINKDHGTAKAFYDLAQKYAQKVKEKFGITLEPEVQLINLSFI